ncbi:MAG: hypothetical protein IPM51_12410 [Sphingobacteriaceae bacterium]|nr:hypothetical protein [Sphingobacteriaceae bacterium]
MASVLSNGGGFYSPAVYVQESKRIGLEVKLPCINKSEYEYTGRGKVLRIGLLAVKNLSRNSIEKIISERKENGKYVSLADFLVRTQLGYEETALLIKCGAMHCFKITRPKLLRLLDIYIHHRKILNENYNDLFMNDTFSLERDVSTDVNYSVEEICRNEYEAFSYMVTRHPLNFFPEWTKDNHIIRAKDMIKNRGKNARMVGWYMTSKRIRTKKGDIMKFLSLEDLTGTFEAVIFPKVYYRVAELTMSMGPYLVEGRIDANDPTNIVVENLQVLTSLRVKAEEMKDSVDHNYYGDKEKFRKRNLTL